MDFGHSTALSKKLEDCPWLNLSGTVRENDACWGLCSHPERVLGQVSVVLRSPQGTVCMEDFLYGGWQIELYLGIGTED